MARWYFLTLATLAGLSVWAATTFAQTAPAKAPEQEDAERLADLVLANHILADQNVLDGFGHVSVRSAKDPKHYFISRSRAPALVTAEDIMEYDLDDHPIDARERSSVRAACAASSSALVRSTSAAKLPASARNPTSCDSTRV